ncbi:MAG: hypothetical protein QGI74_01705 [Phycisphaerales bacterium]|jgi:hypothetical protein|nr:hypothetical protein [Phycisphaerales bacterium]|tara:strand:+ start:379 stop:1041 length:663 start_codon:yes stop_codon:yes gene_type:complete
MFQLRTVVLTSLLCAGPAVGDFLVEDAPTWRGDADTSWYHWESFSSASMETGPNFPTNEQFPSGEALLFNFGDGAVVSGDGNIYGFGGPLNIHAYAYASADVQQAVANISMHGTELLYDQVMLVWNDGIEGGEEGFLFADVSMNYWEEVDFGGGIGAIANVSYTFDLSSVSADIREIGVMFQTAGAHSSLDAMAIDLQTVPAPGVLAVLALAGMRRRRRR